MKSIKKRIVFLGMLLAGLATCLSPMAMVQAEGTAYEEDRGCSITVQLDDLKTERKGVTLSCYPVGVPEQYEGNPKGWKLTEEFAETGVNLNELADPNQHRAAADRLQAYLAECEKIQPVQSKKTDETGTCTFAELQQGMYLIVQEDGFDSYGTIQTFLIGLPYMEEGLLLYDVKTETKGEKPLEEENPPKKPSSSNAKTGDYEKPYLWLAVAGISAAGIVSVLAVSRKKEKHNTQ